MPLPGTPLEEIDTPALVVDLDAAEANIKALQDWCDANGTNARPHVKTHKSPYWARKQVAAGAIGVCAAKVGEAEAMVAGGVTDILVANQIVGPIKIPRLVALAHQATIRCIVDDPDNVRDLSAEATRAGVEIGVLVDINIRINRAGVEPGEPAVELTQAVVDAPGLRFDGLMGYEGHVTPEEQAQTEAVATVARQIGSGHHRRRRGRLPGGGRLRRRHHHLSGVGVARTRDGSAVRDLHLHGRRVRP